MVATKLPLLIAITSRVRVHFINEILFISMASINASGHRKVKIPLLLQATARRFNSHYHRL